MFKNYQTFALLEHVNNQIANENINSMDVVVLRNAKFPLPFHYVIFLEIKDGFPLFIANYPSQNGKKTVQIVPLEDILFYGEKMELKRVRQFKGNQAEQQKAYERAISCIDKKEYSLIFNNCEHLANYVHYGKAYSEQTLIASGTVALIGALGLASDKASVRAISFFIFILALIVFLTEASGTKSFS